MVGGLWEGLFAMVRKHEINEGFLVTGMLFPLTLPPTIPLWQVAIGISFGVVIGKEVFGGTGKNFLNPALTGRAFLYFAYPVEITGDAIWVAVDGFTYATPLGAAAADGMTAVTNTVTWTQAFLGTIPGSMGETSTLACLIGAAILIATRVGSWQIIASMTVATVVCAELLHAIGSDTNPMFGMKRGLAFGAGWICLWLRLYGDRPGVGDHDPGRPLGVWGAHRLYDRADPRDSIRPFPRA